MHVVLLTTNWYTDLNDIMTHVQCTTEYVYFSKYFRMFVLFCFVFFACELENVICRIGRNQMYLNVFYNQVTHVSIQNSSIQLGFWKSVKCLNHKSINRIRVFIGLEMEAITTNIFHATYFEKIRMFWDDPRIVRITCKHFDQNCPIWGFGKTKSMKSSMQNDNIKLFVPQTQNTLNDRKDVPNGNPKR